MPKYETKDSRQMGIHPLESGGNMVVDDCETADLFNNYFVGQWTVVDNDNMILLDILHVTYTY